MGDLHQPDLPLAILNSPKLADATQRLTVKQDDDSYSGRDYTISDQDGTILFTVQGKADQKTFLRNFKDVTGETLLEIRRSALTTTNSWYIETPDPHRRTVLSGDIRMSYAHVKVDCKLSNAAGSGEEVKLELRGRDIKYQETDVLSDGRTIAKVSKTTGTTMPVIPFLNSNKPGKRDTWEVHVAANIDLALAAIFAIMLSDFVTPPK